MAMKIVPIDTLTGSALDWAVVKCEHDKLAMLNIQFPQYADYYPKISPTTEWVHGGPIIEREKIGINRVDSKPDIWAAHVTDPWGISFNVYNRLGDTPLIAAMRCYVASKLGDTVEVPNELL